MSFMSFVNFSQFNLGSHEFRSYLILNIKMPRGFRAYHGLRGGKKVNQDCSTFKCP